MFEDYLKNIEIQKYRVALTRIRLSSHNLMVERGRWGSPKLDIKWRVCKSCGVVKDEYHCLVECERYRDLQKLYLNKSLLRKPSVFKLINMFRGNERQVLQLSKLCSSVLKRYTKLYM